MRNEAGIVKEILQRLREEVGGFWWKVHGGLFQIKGNPDICGCVQGLYIAIEVKDGTNEADKVQLTRIRQIREAGGLAFVCWDASTALRKVKAHVKNFTLQKAKDSRKVIQKSKTTRIIHGAWDWKNDNRFRLRRSKTKKIKKRA